MVTMGNTSEAVVLSARGSVQVIRERSQPAQ